MPPTPSRADLIIDDAALEVVDILHDVESITLRVRRIDGSLRELRGLRAEITRLRARAA